MHDDARSTREARQAALIEHIQERRYPGYSGAWLKVRPLTRIVDAPLGSALLAAGSDPSARLAVQREIVELFVRGHFGDLAGESSRWDEFNAGSWRPVTGEELRGKIDAVFACAAERLAEDEHEAEAGGYLDYHRKETAREDLMVDFAALREWFTASLWDGVPPSYWTLVPEYPEDDELAVLGVSDELVAILWAP